MSNAVAADPLKDCPVIITGASSGIGRATAVRLARQGAALALCGRSPSKLKETLEMVAAAAPHARVFYRAFDITDDAEVRGFVHEAARELGSPRALVHCAGGNPTRAAVARSRWVLPQPSGPQRKTGAPGIGRSRRWAIEE